MKTVLRPFVPILLLLLLLSHPALSCSGAKRGLLLWFHVVLPTLLPFMLCSSLLVAWGGVRVLIRPLTPVRLFFGLTPEGSYCLLSGLLCGYPMGAKTTADFLRSHQISPSEGKRLLALCGCPSPMFAAGYLAPRMQNALSFPVLCALIFSLYLPIFLIGGFLRFFEKKAKFPSCTFPNRTLKNLEASELPFDVILMNCLEIMVKIGGFMMLYSILAAFLEAVPKTMLSSAACSFLLCLTEMTTGIDYTAAHLNGVLAAVLMLFSASFGGLSAVSQTQAVIKNAGLSIRHYVRWKLIHASLSCIILILLLSWQQPLHPVLPLL